MGGPGQKWLSHTQGHGGWRLMQGAMPKTGSAYRGGVSMMGQPGQSLCPVDVEVSPIMWEIWTDGQRYRVYL